MVNGKPPPVCAASSQWTIDAGWIEARANGSERRCATAIADENAPVHCTSDPAAWSYFQKPAPSYRRLYIGWIDSAKQGQTKMRRLRETLGLLAAGKKLGLK